MRYMGGKHRQSKAILAMLSKHPKGTYYAEPFCGALGSAEKLVPHFQNGLLSDLSLPLVNMWLAMRAGWEPPDHVSEDVYSQYAAKRHSPNPNDPMTAWCGYAMSFGGKWFGGLARQGANDPEGTKRSQLNQKRAALRKIKAVHQHVRIMHMDYRDAIRCVPDGAVVYLDPPYADRTRAHHTAKGFDHATFWQDARDLAKRCHVYVSEFQAPAGWEPVHTWGDTVVRHGAEKNENAPTNEQFFEWGGRHERR